MAEKQVKACINGRQLKTCVKTFYHNADLSCADYIYSIALLTSM